MQNSGCCTGKNTEMVPVPWSFQSGGGSEKKSSYVMVGPRKLTSEKAMAPHSSTLAWKIPWTEEPGALQSMGSRRVGHD